MDSNFSSSDEAKAHHILRMGKDLGTIYDALWQEVASVHSKWSEFVVVFGTKESRIKLLNKAAPSFFRLVQDSLWENVLLMGRHASVFAATLYNVINYVSYASMSIANICNNVFTIAFAETSLVLAACE